jgi:hypothetical protein
MALPMAFVIMTALMASLFIPSGDRGSTALGVPGYQQHLTLDQLGSAQEFQASQLGIITILNEHSYPTVGREWTVRFTTKGTHDLTITAVDGTTFGTSTPDDVRFIELSPGSDRASFTVPPLVGADSITFPGYSSGSEAFLKLLVYTPGPHTLRFQFGSDVAYARNTASVGLEQKISDTAGDFTADFGDGDIFGQMVAGIGDINNDGIEDIAVGARDDDDGGTDRGAVYILFMDTDGTVKSFQKISDTAGSFTATLEDGDNFGNSVAKIGDLNNDGIEDIAVGALSDDDGGTNRGALYILFLDTDGTVSSFQKISDTAGGFTATLDDGDNFGETASGIGDINNDGIEDIAVGTPRDDDGGTDRGAVYILFMDTDGTVDDSTGFQKISDTAGGFTATLDDGDLFGQAVPGIGDINNDGVEDIAVGAGSDDDGGTDRGALYILFMDADGTVDDTLGYQKISDTTGGFTATLDNGDQFGKAAAGIGDVNNDGIKDIITGNHPDDDGGTDRGSAYILFMDTDGTVDDTLGYQKISDSEGSFTTTLDDSDGFGRSVSGVGDINNDGIEDVAVSARGDDDGGTDRGAVYILGLDFSPTVNSKGTVGRFQKISDTAGEFTATLDDTDRFGRSASGIGDINKDGIDDIAVGAHKDDDGGNRRGAVYILFMDTDGTVDDSTGFQKISDTAGGFTATLDNGDEFGVSVARIGDLNNDGVEDIAVGASEDDDGGRNRGAVYILFMATDGTVSSFQKISDTAGSFTATLENGDRFGQFIAPIGDLNNDGIEDLAVGVRDDDDGGTDRGAVYILFMDTDGTVKSFQKISDTAGGFTATLDDGDYFGQSVARIGDINNDGIEDIAVGAQGDDDGGTGRGAVYILFMDTDGTVDDTTGFQKISDTAGEFTATLDDDDEFGGSVVGIGDINNDGIEDIAVGANLDDDGGNMRGASYILFMDVDGTVDDTTGFQKISDTAGGFTADLDNGDQFGVSVARIGDINNDGIGDIAVTAKDDDDGGDNRGALYILFMDKYLLSTSSAAISDSFVADNVTSTPTPIPGPVPTPTPEPTPTPTPAPKVCDIASIGTSGAASHLIKEARASTTSAVAVLLEMETDCSHLTGDVIFVASGIDPIATGEVLAQTAATDSDTAGIVLAKVATIDTNAAGIVLAKAATADSAATGNALAKAATVDSAATGNALAKAAAIDSDATGSALAKAAAIDSDATGSVLAKAAAIDSDATGSALAKAATVDSDATGIALAKAATVDSDATGIALAKAAAVDSDATGSALAKAAAVDANASGNALAKAAAVNAAAAGNALAKAASVDASAVGKALAKASSKDSIAVAAGVVKAAEVSPRATGDALIEGSQTDSRSIGNALAIATDQLDEEDKSVGRPATLSTLASTNVEPQLLSAGAIGGVVVSFVSTNPIPNDGVIEVTFPLGFTLSSQVSSAIVPGSTSFDGGHTVEALSHTFSISRLGDGSTIEAASQVHFSINSIKNPMDPGLTGIYKIRIYDNAGALIGQDLSVNADVIYGSLSSTSVVPESLLAGAVGDVHVAFTIASPLPSNGHIVVTFPHGFLLSAIADTGFGENGPSFDGHASVTVEDQKVIITRSGDGSEIGSGTRINLDLNNIQNPSVPGYTGAYAITTRHGLP